MLFLLLQIRLPTPYFVKRLLGYMSYIDCSLNFSSGFSLWATRRGREGKEKNDEKTDIEVRISFYLPSSSQQKASAGTPKHSCGLWSYLQEHPRICRYNSFLLRPLILWGIGDAWLLSLLPGKTFATLAFLPYLSEPLSKLHLGLSFYGPSF